MLVLRPLVVQKFELCGAGIDQGLLLRQIKTCGESKIMPRCDEPQCIALQVQAVAHHRHFCVEFPQCEIVRRELRRQYQARVLEIRLCLLRESSCTLDFSTDPAEQIGLISHGRTHFKIILHDGLIRHRIPGEWTVRRRFAASRSSGQVHPGVQRRADDGHLFASLIEACGGNAQILITAECALDQRI